MSRWICAQLGAREHYAIPRALHTEGLLEFLFTDLWVRPGSVVGRLGSSIRERFHQELRRARVAASNVRALVFEAWTRVRKLSGWDQVIARDWWFQKQALGSLSQHEQPVTLFAYSYAARRLFRLAKQRGWRTVLGQIDPGPETYAINERALRRNPGFCCHRGAPPPGYWAGWREECQLADAIVVNSKWSLETNLRAGTPVDKMRIMPLAFEASEQALNFHRKYPAAFTISRPLRVLFLGQVTMLKGVAELLSAIDMLQYPPVELRIVGPVRIKIPKEFVEHPRIRWLGRVPRGCTADHYRESDVFVFPTLCDGFGLTQLEARAWGLPVVASHHCGDVVEDGVNGIRLAEVNPKSIADVLKHFAMNPGELVRMGRAPRVSPQFTKEELAAQLNRLFDW